MPEAERVIALGFFDGVHIGHGALMDRTRELAATRCAEPTVLSFDRHPDTLIKGLEVPLINSADCREDLIRRLYGINNVLLVHFDRRMMNMPWREFIDSVIGELGAVHLVVGHDFSCGFRGEGRAELIREYCAARGVGCDIIRAVTLDGETVSSTRIRELLLSGQLEKANELLGHPHVLIDTVRSGFRLGRDLGAPTINMSFPEGVLIPRHGVYITRVILRDGAFPAVTNIGTRPTFGDSFAPTVESNILDFDRDLYGEQVRLEFLRFLRPEKSFESANALSEAIRNDIFTARKYFDMK